MAGLRDRPVLTTGVDCHRILPWGLVKRQSNRLSH
jgi:hypothetical protein